MDYSKVLIQNIESYNKKKKAEEEADSRRHTFNPGSMLSTLAAIISAPFTGGASLAALPYTLGEAGVEVARANTGGDEGWGKVGKAISSFGPDVSKLMPTGNTGIDLSSYANTLGNAGDLGYDYLKKKNYAWPTVGGSDYYTNWGAL